MSTRYLGGNTKKEGGNMSQEVRQEIRIWESHQHLVGISSQSTGWDHQKIICKYWGPRTELWSISTFQTQTEKEPTKTEKEQSIRRKANKGISQEAQKTFKKKADIKTAKALSQWLQRVVFGSEASISSGNLWEI